MSDVLFTIAGIIACAVVGGCAGELLFRRATRDHPLRRRKGTPGRASLTEGVLSVPVQDK